jgi:hypothetical protein
VWKKLHSTPVTEETKSTWYIVIRELVPTNVRLHSIRLTESELCKNCGRQDTLIHLLTECCDGSGIWEWTRRRIAWMLWTDPRHITTYLLLSPQLQVWPPQRHRTVLWTLANLVFYQMQTLRILSLLDYIDFMNRARWKS